MSVVSKSSRGGRYVVKNTQSGTKRLRRTPTDYPIPFCPNELSRVQISLDEVTRKCPSLVDSKT